MDADSSGRGTLEDKLGRLVEESQSGSLQEQILSALLLLMWEQGAILRSLETLVREFSQERTGPERRQSPTAPPPAASSTTTVIRSRRWSDTCSFCGKGASEAESMFSNATGFHICSQCIDTFNALRT